MSDRELNRDVASAQGAWLAADAAFRRAYDGWGHGAEGAALAELWQRAEERAFELAERCGDCSRGAGRRPVDEGGGAE